MIGIYKITNKTNGKFYLGSSKNIEKRWDRHRRDLRHRRHHSLILQRSWDKHGESNFAFEIVELIQEDLLLEREQHYLDTLHPYDPQVGYNIGKEATGGDNLTGHPNKEQIIKKITESIHARYANMTEEEKQAYSKKMTGQGNPNFGKKWSATARQKMSQQKAGKPMPEGFKETMSNASKKVWDNESYKEKMCLARMGDGNSFFGKQHDEYTKDHIREVKKAQYKSMSLDRKKQIIPHMKEVLIDDIVYENLVVASKAIGVCRQTIANRIENPKFPNYSYVKLPQESRS